MFGEIAVLGTSLAAKIAGFLGACASLMFVKVLKPVYAAGSVAVGTLGAHYGTQAVLFKWPSVTPVEEPIAFLIGLSAMNLAAWYMSRFPRLLDQRLNVTPPPRQDGEQ